MMLPFGPWEPDRTTFSTSTTTVARNVVPVRDGWGPNPDLVAISQALGSQCLGAVYVISTSGAYFIIAGTRTGLFRLDTTDYSWDNISGPSAPYDVPQGERWSFVQFGANLIATNINDPVQVYNVDAATNFADLGGNPPQAKYVWNAGEFLVLGYINGYPNRVQWSGIGNIEFWEVGLRASDFQDLPDGEDVQGGIGSERGAIIFQRRKIRQMAVTSNSDFAFQIDIVNPDRGAIAALSIASAGPNAFAYLSEAGFFMGAEGRPIGAERIDGWFFENVDQDNIPEVRGVADPYAKVFWWQVPLSNGTKVRLGYNWQLDRWCYADNNVSEMAVITTPGVTIDGLDALYATIDDVSEPFDSRLFTGGKPVFAAFDASNRLGFFSGSAMEATIETGTAELTQGYRSFLQEGYVITDAVNFTLTAGASLGQGIDPTFGSPVSPYAATRKCHFRSSGRLHRIRLDIPSGEVWNHVVAVDVKAVPEGLR